jgi:hypothetical protein
VDHRIDITVAQCGRDPENGDKLLGALYDIEPSTEAVIDQNVSTGKLTASFVMAGDTMGAAVKRGIDVFAAAAVRAGLGTPHAIALSAAECARDEDADLAAV